MISVVAGATPADLARDRSSADRVPKVSPILVAHPYFAMNSDGITWIKRLSFPRRSQVPGSVSF
jgi:hypothetical protein